MIGSFEIILAAVLAAGLLKPEELIDAAGKLGRAYREIRESIRSDEPPIG